MAKSYRIERINETLRELISELLMNRVKDPRIGLVTITAVRVSNDLAVAKVHYSVLGDPEAREKTERGLNSSRSFLRGEITRELKMRSAPDLRFVYDDSLDRSLAIEAALEKTGGDEPGNPGEPDRKDEDNDAS